MVFFLLKNFIKIKNKPQVFVKNVEISPRDFFGSFKTQAKFDWKTVDVVVDDDDESFSDFFSRLFVEDANNWLIVKLTITLEKKEENLSKVYNIQWLIEILFDWIC